MGRPPHTPQGKSTPILIAVFGVLLVLLALSLMAHGVNPYCGQVVAKIKHQSCAGIR